MISKEGYFDWAGTSLYDEDVLKKALEFSLEHWGNPSSVHEAGRDARAALEECREDTARALGVESSSVYFTSGGTEGNHIVLLSLLNRPQRGSIVMSAQEHPALREMARSMRACGWEILNVRPDKDGFVAPESVTEALRDDTALVCVMAVNNETGAIQPLAEIAGAIRGAGGGRRPLFFSDAVQALGKIPLDLNACGVDAASFSIHKIGGPRGFGVLYAARGFEPFLRGGGQERGIRSGTENLFGAKAAALCLEKRFISPRASAAMAHYEAARERTRAFISTLEEIPNCVLIPHTRVQNEECFSPWIVQAAFLGIPGQVMVRALSERGIFISTGSACSSSKKGRPVLDSLGIPPREKESSVRFSFGPFTTEEQMQRLMECVRDVCLQFS